MAVDLLTNFPGWSTNFELMFRQERSRTASGRTLVKDLGDPLWRAVYQTRVLRPSQLSAWRAKLDAMGNGIGIFEGRDLSRCFPIADPRGTILGNPTLTISAVGVDNKSLTFTGAPGGYAIRQGDMLSFTLASGERFLHRVTADGLAGASLSVAPNLPSGTLIGRTVELRRPWVPMSIVPGSITTSSDLDGRGTVTFEGLEAR